MTIESTYNQLRENANNQMKRGDLTGYLKSLIQLQQMRKELSMLLRNNA